MTILLLALGCTPLVGDWEGEVDCGDYAMNLSITLEAGDGRYEGEGELDCTDYLGYACEQTFEVQVDAEGFMGEQDLDVDLDECYLQADAASGEVGCDNPDDMVWDGGDAIEGEWSTCDVELTR